MHDFGDAPAAEIRHAEVANLAGLDQRAERPHRLRERRLPVVDVQVVDIDPVGAKAREAFVARAQDPAPRQTAGVREFAAGQRHRIAGLRREDPARAVGTDRRARDRFGRAVRVYVCGVDEVDARVARVRDDLARLAFAGAVAEHHRAEAHGRHAQTAFPELPVVHFRYRFQNRADAMRAPSAIAANFAHTTSGSTAAWPTHVP